jgi:hypothetical protein
VFKRLKKTKSSPRKAGKGGTGTAKRKVIKRKVIKRGLTAQTPRNKIISRVPKIKLI